MLKSTTWRRLSVMFIDDMIASYFFACRPGIRPSHGWLTTSHGVAIALHSA
ncbi:hypothetical protein D3C78_1875540 [compost metagenome]